MTHPFQACRPGRVIFITAMLVLLLICLSVAASLAASPPKPAPADDVAALLDGYRHVEVASVSDAVEQLPGRRMYMSHRMRPRIPAKFAGLAVTVEMKKEENNDPNAVQGMLAAIDQGGPNSVYVMVVQDGVDIAGMGGRMGTARAARAPPGGGGGAAGRVGKE